MKIAIIGPYPPVYGGISVHIKRLKEFLECNDIECAVYDELNKSFVEKNIYPMGRLRKFIFKRELMKYDIIHFHSVDVKTRSIMGFYKFLGKKIIFTSHGESIIEDLKKSKFIYRKMILNSLKKVDKILCVNNKVAEELLQFGIDKDKIKYISAYINPIEDENDDINIPSYVWDFMNTDDIVITANGAIREHKGEELYGLDMLINLMDKLKNLNKSVRLIFSVLAVDKQTVEEKKHYDSLKKLIKEKELEDRILLFEPVDCEFYPILKRSNVFIRPTNTDGYALSLAEAIHLKVPCIASDICYRPEGTILFKTRDDNDLLDKTKTIIENYDYYKEVSSNYKVKDSSYEILDIYKKL